MEWYGIIGLIAAACISVYCLPELIHVIKTKNTCGISIWMLILMLAGDFFFVLNAIGIFVDPDNHHNIDAGLPLLLANGIAFIVGAILMAFKLRSMHYSKKFQTTEKQFCENYESYRTKIRMAKAEKEAAKKVEVPSDPTAPIAGE